MYDKVKFFLCDAFRPLHQFTDRRNPKWRKHSHEIFYELFIYLSSNMNLGHFIHNFGYKP